METQGGTRVRCVGLGYLELPLAVVFRRTFDTVSFGLLDTKVEGYKHFCEAQLGAGTRLRTLVMRS